MKRVAARICEVSEESLPLADLFRLGSEVEDLSSVAGNLDNSLHDCLSPFRIGDSEGFVEDQRWAVIAFMGLEESDTGSHQQLHSGATGQLAEGLPL